jgi:hypothetical protein
MACCASLSSIAKVNWILFLVAAGQNSPQKRTGRAVLVTRLCRNRRFDPHGCVGLSGLAAAWEAMRGAERLQATIEKERRLKNPREKRSRGIAH